MARSGLARSRATTPRIVDDHYRFDVHHGFAYDLVPPNGEATQEDGATHPWSSSSVGAADDFGLLEFVEPAAPNVAGTRGLMEVRPQWSASGKFGVPGDAGRPRAPILDHQAIDSDGWKGRAGSRKSTRIGVE